MTTTISAQPIKKQQTKTRWAALAAGGLTALVLPLSLSGTAAASSYGGYNHHKSYRSNYSSYSSYKYKTYNKYQHHYNDCYKYSYHGSYGRHYGYWKKDYNPWSGYCYGDDKYGHDHYRHYNRY